MLAALRGTRPLGGAPVAVIGCGAAGRAAAFALSNAGARVTLVNHEESRGCSAANRLRLPFIRLDAFRPAQYAVLVHATPLADRLPFPIDGVPASTVVADFVCAARTTVMVLAAQRRGLATIDGRDVLASEVKQQFELMTGRQLPLTVDYR
jgi:3-dehydroquinate dehydratase/shikimate dehydrogenase